MGIKNLNKILSENGYTPEQINIKFLKHKTVAIDTSIFLYKFSYGGKMIESFLKQIISFLDNNITPFYIFDGKSTQEKEKLITERQNKYENNKKKIDQVITETRNDFSIGDNIDATTTVEKIKKVNIKINKSEIEDLKNLLTNMGIMFYQCNGETDLFCRFLSQNNIVNYFITEDMDFLTHNCKFVITKFSFTSKFYLYDNQKMLNAIKLNRNQFIDMCILLGCDYTKTVKGIGMARSYPLIKQYETIENIINIDNKYDSTNCDFISARNMFINNNILHITNFSNKDKIKNKKIDIQLMSQFLERYSICEKYIDKITELSRIKVSQMKDLSFLIQ